MSTLFIVESKSKIPKLQKILGSKYLFTASDGHFMNLHDKEMSIDFDNNFEPMYVVAKPYVAARLKSLMAKATNLVIATDLDVEGEAIAQSIYNYLKPKKYIRITFNSVTKNVILKALENGGKINKDIVNSQKARRVIDRLYGYMISPVVNIHTTGKSAGRVQSVTTKIVIDKELEIKNFLEENKDATFFKSVGYFSGLKSILMKATDDEKIDYSAFLKCKIAQIPLSSDKKNPNKKVKAFLDHCLESVFKISSVTDKMTTRSPSPPFITSTLQQESSRKLGMSIDVTMKVAQTLYEAGYITYMRTDSVEISEEGHEEIKKVIVKEYGKKYYQKNEYKNKSSSAQEAHECIRPTYPDLLSLDGEVEDKWQIKLYKLIWNRTIASQMKAAEIKVYTVQISISAYVKAKLDPYYFFQSQVEEVVFPGFMEVYVESVDDAEEEDTGLKNKQLSLFKKSGIKVGDKLAMESITVKQEYLRPPPRYTEASLVKKIEALGIGRPATYVPSVKVIQDKKYVEIANCPGIEKDIMTFVIKAGKISESSSKILLGKDAKKIVPTDIGIDVTKFLLKNFPEMLDYKFTAKLEKDFDAIRKQKKVWSDVVRKYYDVIKPKADELKAAGKMMRADKGQLLGKDADDNEIYALDAKFGPAVRKFVDGKYLYANIEKPLKLKTIKLKDAIELFEKKGSGEFPKTLGQYEGTDVLLYKGKFGFYLVHNKFNYPVDRDISADKSKKEALKEAIEVIDKKKSSQLGTFVIKERNKDVRVIAALGVYGPYLRVMRDKKNVNYKIPGGYDIKKLTPEIITEIIKKNAGTGAPQKIAAGSKTNKKPRTPTAKTRSPRAPSSKTNKK